MEGKTINSTLLNWEKEEELAIKTFGTGENFQCQKYFGCHSCKRDQKNGFIFRVWAPNAQQVWLVGDFNNWDESIPMTFWKEYGVWIVFSDKPISGSLYKYKVKQQNGEIVYKIDPFALRFEKRPADASIVYQIPKRKWRDGLWFGRKKRSNYFKRPLNIYEVHASSWKHDKQGNPYTFEKLTEELIPYVREMGYTHIEFMPLMEHPLGMSWGYQLTGYFAVSSYYGTPEEFQLFVETCHLANIGVLVDWVPGHFCINYDALAYYDGTPQFEYYDQIRAQNVRWGALNFDLGKPEVQSFLISNALFWLETFHLDGIRVDAVSNMIYRDYDEGPYLPNHEGGNTNLEGVYFLQKLNAVIKALHPEVIMIAEESSAETKITGKIEDSLGFDFKWNMGWMNDTLRFYEMDPIYRKDQFQLITFSFTYMFNEQFVLPLSHDEVVHGKKSLMHKMWGDRYRQFAQLRNLYVYFMTHPGKKLLFMGSEWGQFLEWKYDDGLEWSDLSDELNQKMHYFTHYLNQFYKEQRSLWELETGYETLEMIDADNKEDTVLSFIRKGKSKNDFLVVILNFTPVERYDFPIGVPYEGVYEELLNSEMLEYGGTWTTGNPARKTIASPYKHLNYQIKTIVPAFGALILKLKK